VSRGRATATGFGAVLLWAALALFAVGAGPVPPFLLSAICFAIGGLLGIGWAAFRGVGPGALVRQLPTGAWLVGTGGLFGYHAAYFTAVQNAPPEQASLIAYLWPLLIVLFSGLLPGERLRAGHVAGALIAFAGAGLVVSGPGTRFDAAHAGGYLAAAACALIWSGYSVLSRRFGAVPTEAVGLFCIATAVLSLGAHLALETTVWPVGTSAWAATLALGLGPVGLAFFLWDVGVKRGDIQVLGVASYAAPLLSTLLLIATGFAAASLSLVLAAGLIAGGALVAARAGR
jgi:drug/metabolite transporter (DMT)-like permease